MSVGQHDHLYDNGRHRQQERAVRLTENLRQGLGMVNNTGRRKNDYGQQHGENTIRQDAEVTDGTNEGRYFNGIDDHESNQPCDKLRFSAHKVLHHVNPSALSKTVLV
jgi:hypothetical protein